MKLTIKEIAPAARLLEVAKCSTLNDNDFNATLKVANAICPIYSDVAKQEERVRESAKPSDWEEIVELIQKAKKESITPDEAERVNKAVADYNGKVSKAIADIEAKEYDIDVEPLPASVPAKLLRENNWPFGAIADLKAVTKAE
jgi:hypothetical protein